MFYGILTSVEQSSWMVQLPEQVKESAWSGGLGLPDPVSSYPDAQGLQP